MTTGLPRERLRVLFGTDEPPAAVVPLSAGSLTAAFDDGGVRAIAWNGVEILRGIAFLIRDEAWGTRPASLSEPAVRQDEHGFEVSWSGVIGSADDGFRFKAQIEGRATGSFRFHVEGRPGSDLTTNRAGFVVLHPAHAAGSAVTLVDVEGRETPATFPELVSPGQPFFDLRALRQRVPGVGDVTCSMLASLPSDPLGRFETEDQRNWSDASFKTYVGSLLDPWPYTLPAGTPFEQQVELTIEPGRLETKDARHTERVAPGARAVMPDVGVGVPHAFDATTPAVREAMRALRPGHVVIELDMRRDGLAGHLSAAAALARSCPVQLEIIAPTIQSPAAELRAAADACALTGLRPGLVLVVPAPLLKSHQPSGPWPDIPDLPAWYAAAREAFPHAAVGGGMATNFTELNRKRPDPEGLAFISHTTTAIVHAADDRSVMETLEAIPHIARTVRALFPGVPYRIGPSSIAMRSNPYGATAPRNPEWRRMPLADRDPRQRGLFGAAWTVGFAAAAVAGGADAIALHASHGPLGLTDEQGRPWPCYHAVAALASSGGRARHQLDLPPELAGLAWSVGGDRPSIQLLVANLTDVERPLPWRGAGRVLDEATADEARADLRFLFGPPRPAPATLGPFATAFLTL